MRAPGAGCRSPRRGRPATLAHQLSGSSSAASGSVARLRLAPAQTIADQHRLLAGRDRRAHRDDPAGKRQLDPAPGGRGEVEALGDDLPRRLLADGDADPARRCASSRRRAARSPRPDRSRRWCLVRQLMTGPILTAASTACTDRGRPRPGTASAPARQASLNAPAAARSCSSTRRASPMPAELERLLGQAAAVPGRRGHAARHLELKRRR